MSGGQVDVVWLPVRTPHVGTQHVWRLTAYEIRTGKIPIRKTPPIFLLAARSRTAAKALNLATSSTIHWLLYVPELAMEKMSTHSSPPVARVVAAMARWWASVQACTWASVHACKCARVHALQVCMQ